MIQEQKVSQLESLYLYSLKLFTTVKNIKKNIKKSILLISTSSGLLTNGNELNSKTS